MDHFIGKNACLDVWPGLLRFLDKYAENDVLKDKSFLKSLKKSLSVRLVPEKKKPGKFKIISLLGSTSSKLILTRSVATGWNRMTSPTLVQF